MKSKKLTHSTRKPSKLETQLRMSIQLAKLQRRIKDLEEDGMDIRNRLVIIEIEKDCRDRDLAR
jgi:hypothetical protein